MLNFLEKEETWLVIWIILTVLGFALVGFMLTNPSEIMTNCNTYNQHDCHKNGATIALFFAGLLPPFLLWLEYLKLGKKLDNADNKFEKFKYGQEVGRNIWLAFVALIAALYFQ